MGQSRLEGILMPMPMPFNEDGTVDGPALDAVVEFYIAAGVDGLFPFGTHGQGMVMEIDERKKAAEQIVRRVKGRVSVVLHCGTANTFSSIDLAQHAAALEIDAIAVIPPYYYPHNDFEIYAHFQKVAAAVPGIPLFIYDNPETTRLHLTPPKVLKLLETVPNMAGIKVSFSSFEQVLQYVRRLPPNMGVFPGSIFSLYTGYSLGVRGTIHPPTCFVPEICVRMFQALKKDDLKGAREAHNKITNVLAAIQPFTAAHGKGVFAELMRLRGVPVKRYPRWECQPFTDQERRQLKESLEKVGLEPALR
jgi:dihydrodipicolinate synthase/N-acetylneuraminate lyase